MIEFFKNLIGASSPWPPLALAAAVGALLGMRRYRRRSSERTRP